MAGERKRDEGGRRRKLPHLILLLQLERHLLLLTAHTRQALITPNDPSFSRTLSPPPRPSQLQHPLLPFAPLGRPYKLLQTIMAAQQTSQDVHRLAREGAPSFPSLPPHYLKLTRLSFSLNRTFTPFLTSPTILNLSTMLSRNRKRFAVEDGSRGKPGIGSEDRLCTPSLSSLALLPSPTLSYSAYPSSDPMFLEQDSRTPLQNAISAIPPSVQSVEACLDVLNQVDGGEPGGKARTKMLENGDGVGNTALMQAGESSFSFTSFSCVPSLAFGLSSRHLLQREVPT
jgi:hypothetical protein